jgi:hypothetical protein
MVLQVMRKTAECINYWIGAHMPGVQTYWRLVLVKYPSAALSVDTKVTAYPAVVDGSWNGDPPRVTELRWAFIPYTRRPVSEVEMSKEEPWIGSLHPSYMYGEFAEVPQEAKVILDREFHPSRFTGMLPREDIRLVRHARKTITDCGDNRHKVTLVKQYVSKVWTRGGGYTHSCAGVQCL